MPSLINLNDLVVLYDHQHRVFAQQFDDFMEFNDLQVVKSIVALLLSFSFILGF